MSNLNPLERVEIFHNIYRKFDSDWIEACEQTKQNPYSDWNDVQWDEWHRLIQD